MGEYLKRLKELRTQKGISQKEIADYLGTTAAAYSLYERGNREPSISILKKIAEYYNVSIDYLIGWDIQNNNSYDTDESANPNINITPLEWESAKPQTLAAHFDGSIYTDEELSEIRNFAEFVKNRRKK